MSSELTFDDISSVICLVREVCDRWDDPPAWREYLLLGACRLLHGNLGMMITDEQVRKTGFGKPMVLAAVGLGKQTRAVVEPSMARYAQRNYDEVTQNLMPGITN